MKTKREHFILNAERGNAMIYVLIAIVLFAALSLTFARQSDTGEAGDLSDSKAKLYATQFIAYATAAKSSIDQMQITGTRIDNLNFLAPTDAAFNTPPNTAKVYHPDGGGLNPGVLPADATDNTLSTPAAGWYMGRFNNVEWSKTSANDVILTAYGIKKSICAQINMRATGSETIPKLTVTASSLLVPSSYWGGANTDMTTSGGGSACAACDHKPSLCVEDKNSGIFAYYTVLADQ